MESRDKTLARVRASARRCKACPLWKIGTQTVFGEGRADAPLLLVGEQPGDQEDRAGHPFVGPAGQVLDRALAAAKIEREDCFVTNAVKHFKWEPRGKRRLHKKPADSEVAACHQWLEQEMAIVAPRLVLCLGATAAQSLLGKSFRVTRERGRLLEGEGRPALMATVHPSSILRRRSSEEREAAFQAFVRDLGAARRYLERR